MPLDIWIFVSVAWRICDLVLHYVDAHLGSSLESNTESSDGNTDSQAASTFCLFKGFEFAYNPISLTLMPFLPDDLV